MQQFKKSILSLLVLLLYLFAALPLTVFSADKDKTPCKNYVDCKYNEGFFCVNGNCKNVCSGGKVASGVDANGASLSCQSGYSFSGFNDKSGRKVCCPKKVESKVESVQSVTQFKALGKLCKETKDCKEGEFCSNTESNVSRCGIFNCDGSYISRIKCPLEEISLAEGPEGYFCCPLVFLGKSSSSSGGQESSSSSSGGNGSSSSSSGGSSSSSSGGRKQSSSSGAVKDYNVQIVLQTPEIITGKNLSENIPLFKVASSFGSSSGAAQAVAPPIETHNYKAGEKLAFSVYVKGPSLSKPQDVSSYTVTAIANEKVSSSNSPSLRILELSVNDIIACTDLQSFLSNPIPLNVALIKQDSKGIFNAVNADTFKLKLPDARYLGSTSGRIVLASPDTSLKAIPENKCSPGADKVCGVDNISVANCINYSCWKYSKGSPFSKECCKGTLLENLKDEIPTTSSSSGAVVIPKPSCNKVSKEIECKTTNKYLVPYCSNRNNPECDKDGKPICKQLSSSGIVSLEDPSCIPYSQSTENYCKDVSSLLYANGFDPASCVNDFCTSLKSTEEKRICCTACGIVYDKAKSPNITLDEIDQMKSCFDFNGGLCGSVKQSQSCIEGACYKKEANSDDMKICCSKYDKDGSVIRALLKEGRLEEDKGMIYNLISVGKNPIRIQKSAEDIIAQNFELLLPSDPSIESVVIRASIKDKKGKVKDSNVKILLFNEEKIEEKAPVAASPDKQNCNAPEISSLRVADKARINAVVGNSIEIPIVVNDKDNDIASLKITGLPSGLMAEDVTKMPSYYYSEIKGSVKEKGKHSISVLCTDKCGKTSSLNFEIHVRNRGEQIPKDDSLNEILPNSSPSPKPEENKVAPIQ